MPLLIALGLLLAGFIAYRLFARYQHAKARRAAREAIESAETFETMRERLSNG